ncbi:MAG: erythromycin esterase family protein [Euryarchaeota archaeon]|nr:erythromycin esterase family protein [Euryarchaeota archaeon]
MLKTKIVSYVVILIFLLTIFNVAGLKNNNENEKNNHIILENKPWTYKFYTDGAGEFPLTKPNWMDSSYLSIVKSLNSIIHPLKSSPLELNDADLDVLAYMGDCKIVGLGEATHGTKEFFQLKHRIFRYLVENYGFKIFAFECDMGESYYVNKFVTEGVGNLDNIMKNIMSFWTWRTEEVKNLLLWMREYNEHKSDGDKIYFIGVDCQDMTYQSDIIKNYFDKANISLPEDCIQFLNEIKQMGSNYSYYLQSYYSNMTLDKKEEIDQNVDILLSKFQDLKNELLSVSSEFKYQFIKQIVLNIKQVNDVRYGYAHDILKNYRDMYMANNSLWTSALFGEDTKVALWAHNDHIAYYESNGSIGGSIGFYLKEELKEKYQIIGFACSLGRFTAMNRFNFLTIHNIKPKLGSINYVFHRARYDNFILRESDIQTDSDFDKWISEPQLFLDIGSVFYDFIYPRFFYYHPTDLKEMYDVIIYWDVTKAAQQLN